MNENNEFNDNYDEYADEMLRRIVSCVKQEIKKTSPKIESAVVANVNSDGTVDVMLPREKESKFTRIQNQTPFKLKEGDSVEIMLKTGSFNNCWITAKHETTFKNIAPINYRISNGGGGSLPQPSEFIYVVGKPVDFVLTNWDEIENGHTYILKANGANIGENGIQIGLPYKNDNTSNTQEVINSALTIPHTEYISPDTEKNIAGYTNIWISAVNIPKKDITIAIFGLEEALPRVIITQKDILGINSPVKGEIAVQETDVNEQYNATVVWNPAISKGSSFVKDTAYTATITLVPKWGYKLDGVPENFFALNGATTITNQANSGIVQVTFPKTAAE